MKQKIVERAVVNGAVQISGNWFVPLKGEHVKNGTRCKFVVFFRGNTIQSPIYRVFMLGDKFFQRWKEDKSQRCMLGAKQ